MEWIWGEKHSKWKKKQNNDDINSILWIWKNALKVKPIETLPPNAIDTYDNVVLFRLAATQIWQTKTVILTDAFNNASFFVDFPVTIVRFQNKCVDFGADYGFSLAISIVECVYREFNEWRASNWIRIVSFFFNKRSNFWSRTSGQLSW